MTKVINLKISKLEDLAYTNAKKVTLVRRHHIEMKQVANGTFETYEIDACSCNGYCGGNFRYEGCSCNGYCGSNYRKD